MDPLYDPLARDPLDRQHAAGHPEETRRVPRLPPRPEAAQARAEGQTRDRLRHPPDQAAPQQPAGLPAQRGQARQRHRRRLEGPRVRRARLRGVAPLRAHAPRAPRPLGQEVQAQVRDPRDLGHGQGAAPGGAGLQALQAHGPQGAHQETRGVRVGPGRAPGPRRADRCYRPGAQCPRLLRRPGCQLPL